MSRHADHAGQLRLLPPNLPAASILSLIAAPSMHLSLATLP